MHFWNPLDAQSSVQLVVLVDSASGKILHFGHHITVSQHHTGSGWLKLDHIWQMSQMTAPSLFAKDFPKIKKVNKIK